MKTATQVLYEHGINIMSLNDDFNTQLLHAMERYSEEKNKEKDLIIKGLEEGSECWKAEYDNCRSILSALVALKHEKEINGKTELYQQQQPRAWATAKLFLEKYQHQ